MKELNVKELRIGNLIRIHSLTDGSIETVETNHFHLNEIGKTIKYQYKPININKTYLNMFGFTEFHHKGLKGYISDKMELLYNLDSHQIYSYNEVDGSIWNLARCKHVHTLQNLYFALENNELTIRE